MWHAWSWPLIEERPQRSLALSRIFLFMAAFSSSHVEAWLHVHCPGLEKKWRRPNNNFKPCTRLVTGSTGATTNEDIPLSSYSTANCNEGPNYKFHSACDLGPTASNSLLQACHSSNSAVHSKVWICFENWGSKAHSVHPTAKRDYDSVLQSISQLRHSGWYNWMCCYHEEEGPGTLKRFPNKKLVEFLSPEKRKRNGKDGSTFTYRTWRNYSNVVQSASINHPTN